MLRIVSLLFVVAAAACAQTPVARVATPDAATIVQQFGPSFQPLPKFPVLTADLDGDGMEDALVVATSEDPLLDEAQFHYKVIDPFSSFFGLGDPKITSKFAVETDKPRFLLVVHDWRAPKVKFVILNLPFEKISVSRTLIKKKPINAIRAEEASGMKSIIYWDGKRWKWKEQSME